MKLLICLGILLITGCAPEFVETKDEALYNNARSLYEIGNYSEALAEFTRVIDECPWSGKVDDSWYYSGLSYLGLAEVDEELVAPEYLPEAISSFQQLKESDNHYADGLFETGYAYYLAGEYDSSLAYHTDLLNRYPQSTKADNATLYTGHYYRKTGESDSSIVWYEKVIAEFPQDGAYDNGLYWAGDYYYDRRSVDGNKEKAIDYLTEFCSIADTADDKYMKAVSKLSKMGVTL